MSIQNKIERVFDMFESSFIHNKEELILHKKWNIYFRLPDIKTEYEFDYKLLSYLSFYTASNHFKQSSVQYQWAINRIRRWFRRDFTNEDLQAIYIKLGCGANRELGVAFIISGLDMRLLDEKEAQQVIGHSHTEIIENDYEDVGFE
jgi:hypothetical protein